MWASEAPATTASKRYRQGRALTVQVACLMLREQSQRMTLAFDRRPNLDPCAATALASQSSVAFLRAFLVPIPSGPWPMPEPLWRVLQTAASASLTVGTVMERKATTLRLNERPVDPKTGADGPGPVKLPLNRVNEDVRPFGLTLTEVTPDLATLYKLEGQKGLLVKEINPESYIADVKLSNGVDALGEGDLIQKINRVAVTDVKSFTAMVSKLKSGDPVVMQILTFNARTRTAQVRIVQFSVQ